ncbi:unnamed protein product, partial [Rotaria socialis]
QSAKIPSSRIALSITLMAADPDPIWYCEIARLCPINDNGDAKFVKFSVLPSTGPQGTTFEVLHKLV